MFLPIVDREGQKKSNLNSFSEENMLLLFWFFFSSQMTQFLTAFIMEGKTLFAGNGLSLDSVILGWHLPVKRRQINYDN